jgi:membrane protein YdbS with pleckstrin-like domain
MRRIPITTKLEKSREGKMTSEHPNEPGHGDSIAAWVAVIIIIVASGVATWAYYFDMFELVWASGVVVVLGVISGVVLARLGYGIKGKR